jgi:hypothetical protein
MTLVEYKCIADCSTGWTYQTRHSRDQTIQFSEYITLRYQNT